MSAVTDLTRSERLALGDTLDGLTPEQWSADSLCEGWRVADVAAHLAWMPVIGLLGGMSAMARHRLSVNRMIARTAVDWSARGREATLAQLRYNAASGARPPAMPAVAALADAVVHGIDVRHPLGLAHDVPPAAVAPVAGFALTVPGPAAGVIGGSARRLVDGVRLVVPDADWSHGSGPEVTLTPDAALRLLYHRPVAASELSGPGATLLAPASDPAPARALGPPPAAGSARRLPLIPAGRLPARAGSPSPGGRCNGHGEQH